MDYPVYHAAASRGQREALSEQAEQYGRAHRYDSSIRAASLQREGVHPQGLPRQELHRPPLPQAASSRQLYERATAAADERAAAAAASLDNQRLGPSLNPSQIPYDRSPYYIQSSRLPPPNAAPYSMYQPSAMAKNPHLPPPQYIPSSDLQHRPEPPRRLPEPPHLPSRLAYASSAATDRSSHLPTVTASPHSPPRVTYAPAETDLPPHLQRSLPPVTNPPYPPSRLVYASSAATDLPPHLQSHLPPGTNPPYPPSRLAYASLAATDLPPHLQSGLPLPSGRMPAPPHLSRLQPPLPPGVGMPNDLHLSRLPTAAAHRGLLPQPSDYHIMNPSYRMQLGGASQEDGLLRRGQPFDNAGLDAPPKRLTVSKRPPFPIHLMQAMILHETDQHEQLYAPYTPFKWLNGGSSFIVVHEDAFCDFLRQHDLLDRYAKYPSIVRKLSRWGFGRKKVGAGHCFHHKFFQRGRFDLAVKMENKQRK